MISDLCEAFFTLGGNAQVRFIFDRGRTDQIVDEAVDNPAAGACPTLVWASVPTV